ncbi:MAG: AI-2E family transporter [Flavobacterium sp.]|mgnify:FL=1|jgi:predicted PurR-regulated permease PerM|uniref:AI-2E family transporter n=1 Tax=Flavobacterium sp. TaxID=239 RepID=UPI001B4907FC|nr:AI-2E family transporter [Flavobacterium sp.]MBP6146426.1 AI-2E family transporter [Flavobacterium sp.]MBP7316809.1 AI-2E family transporter [Flavobacterium sp.]MBP7396684.1 AI-2E family transporter [Flavobacterium sp.]HRL71972.1 AI-2E family transporter [Flavobacterium sp.]HRM45520.1 AI-2E family transporter [Flavobacterium sp.]
MKQSSKIPDLFQTSRRFSVLEILQFIVLLSLILYFGKTLFIPLSFSLLVGFILYPICKWMETKGINKGIAIVISILGVTLLAGAIIYLLFVQFSEFLEEWQSLRIKLSETINQLSVFISERFDISLKKQTEFINNTLNNSGSQAFSIVRNTAYSLSESVFFLLMIPVFSTLILFHRQMLSNALYELFPKEKKNTIHEILVETINAYYNFIKGMLVVYLIVGLLNSIGLLLIGVPHPFLFGFIASILTFIPYVGIMISSLLPIAISWITYNSIWYPLAVIAVFSIVQLLEAYLIFPFAVGNRLKINTLVIIIAIIVGGILWGAAGMILFIPFVSVMKLIADRTPSLKTLSVLLGDGEQKKTIK